MTPIRILDPTVGPDPVEVGQAPRLAALDGKALGLLANGKVNGDRLLALIGEELRGRYRLREVVAVGKPNASLVAEPQLLADLARRCDAVVTAIGD